MSIAELIEKRRSQLQSIIEENIPFKTAVLDTVARQGTRIFIDGKSTAGATAQYDTKRPLYINPDKAPRKTASKVQGIQGLLPTKGKTGKHTFKNGNVHKTTYVNNYKDFRNRMGKRVDIVNKELSGDLASDFKAAYAGGDHNPERISAHEYHVTVKRDLNAKKIEGLEKKYGKIFALSQTEKAAFMDILKKELAIALQ